MCTTTTGAPPLTTAAGASHLTTTAVVNYVHYIVDNYATNLQVQLLAPVVLNILQL